MPKIKTNKSASKRFKITGSGKIMRNRASVSHKNMKKRGRKLRELSIPQEVTHGDKKRVKRLLGKIK